MAGVIKASQLRGGADGGKVFQLGDFVAEGRQLIEAAQAKADQILADARAEAERTKQASHEQGREEGFAQGIEEGREQGRAEAREQAKQDFEARHVQMASACESLFRDVDRHKRELLLASHRDLIVLAVAIAERVTKRIGLLDRQAVTDNLTAVIDLVGQSSDLIVEVNPVDAETLELFAPDLVARRNELKHVEVIASEAVEPGGCLLRTRGGLVDATLQAQLDRIAEELVPGRDRPPTEPNEQPDDAADAPVKQDDPAE